MCVINKMVGSSKIISALKKCPVCDVGTLVHESKPVLIEENGLLLWKNEYLYSCDHIQTINTVPRPIDVIEDAINKKKGFEGIILANVFFENLAYRVMCKYLENNNIQISKKKIEQLNLHELIMFLYGMKLINKEIYLKMIEVKDNRNKLVHSKSGTIDMKRFYLFVSNEDRVNKLLKMAKDVIECLERKEEEL